MLCTASERQEEANNTEQQESLENNKEGDEHGRITMEELRELLKKIKNRKGTGHEKITDKMLKYMGSKEEEVLLQICNIAWKE